jgi:polysaccharide pyruvyl transferase WcaK-like protein
VIAQWPPGRPRLLVADAWLANGGDGAIALATERRLRRLVPQASVLHAAYQCDLVADRYPELALVPPLDGMLGVVPEPELEAWDPDAASALLDGADAVLSQGGGFTMEHYHPWQRLRAWELVVEREIPLAFCAQTIGPWRAARERAMLGHAFRAAVAVGVRERTSAGNAIELGADPDRVVHGADEAFALLDSPPQDSEPHGFAAVLTGHGQVFESGAVSEAGIEHVTEVAAALAALAGDEGLLLLSTQQGLGGLDRGLEDDAELARAVVERLPRELARRISRLEGYVDPLQFARAVAGRRALLTMRMHPAILGLSSGVPTVAIDPGFKTLGVLEEAGMGDVMAAGDDPGEVARRVQDAAAGPRGLKLWERLEGARRRAAANDEVVRRLLAAAGARCA